jgi:hypothetical protein
MKVAPTILLLFSTLGLASAQNAAPQVKSPFAVAVDTLRATMLKLTSNHTLTAADGKVLPYNLSILDVSGNPSTCAVTWKAHTDLGSENITETVVVKVREIQRVNSLSSINTKMNVDPAIQIVQIHMNPNVTVIRTSERFNPDGSLKGTPETNQGPVAVIYANSESEGTAVVKQLTDVMMACNP